MVERRFYRYDCLWGVLTRNPAYSDINIIIKNLAIVAQLPDARTYSSHSLRRGFATTASKLGAPFGAIKRQGRWQHEEPCWVILKKANGLKRMPRELSYNPILLKWGK